MLTAWRKRLTEVHFITTMKGFPGKASLFCGIPVLPSMGLDFYLHNHVFHLSVSHDSSAYAVGDLSTSPLGSINYD